LARANDGKGFHLLDDLAEFMPSRRKTEREKDSLQSDRRRGQSARDGARIGCDGTTSGYFVILARDRTSDCESDARFYEHFQLRANHDRRVEETPAVRLDRTRRDFMMEMRGQHPRDGRCGYTEDQRRFC
jgi:hypothetical protein